MRRYKRIITILIIVIAVLVITIISGTIYIMFLNKKIKNLNINSSDNVQDEISLNGQLEDVSLFNDEFTSYEGTGLTARQIKDVIEKAKTSNINHNDRQILVSTEGEGFSEQGRFEEATNDINKLKVMQESINESRQYSVGLQYNDEGYINKITIKTRSVDEVSEINDFNLTFMAYSGKTITGKQLQTLTIDVKTSNQMNPEHQINIYASDVQNIQDINLEENYEIIISYDYEGYINRIDAIKKN